MSSNLIKLLLLAVLVLISSFNIVTRAVEYDEDGDVIMEDANFEFDLNEAAEEQATEGDLQAEWNNMKA